MDPRSAARELQRVCRGFLNSAYGSVFTFQRERSKLSGPGALFRVREHRGGGLGGSETEGNELTLE